MQLRQLSLIGHNGLSHIQIENGRISRITEEDNALPADSRVLAGNAPPANDPQGSLAFGGAIAFPGLINSHDHLDFNLFPQLRSHIYKTYTEWGTDIHERYGEKIGQVLKIPGPLRTRWGIYKNLLNGITTVVHHGKKLNVQEDLISIDQQTPSFHSVSGERSWQLKLIDPFSSRRPVAIHIGEGILPVSTAEIDTLIKWNIFSRPLIGIHGVAMNEQQAGSFQALVWCPDSNYFLLGATAAIDRLKDRIPILFGTDSTLTASWNIWEHLRLARRQKMVSDRELFDMLGRIPAKIWRLSQSGSLSEGQWADIVIARPPGHLTGWDAFYALDPENILLVLHRGNVRLFDPAWAEQLAGAGLPLENFSKISIHGQVKYVQGDLPGLMNEIRKHHPSVQFPISEG